LRTADLPEAVARLGVTDILLAMPSLAVRRNEIIERLREVACVHVRTLPGMVDASGESRSSFQELDE
jgi:FlaA1/EpsC-like NDP-sugar epimerase